MYEQPPPNLFTSHERDRVTGRDHTWFRQHSSQLGRWSSADPLGGHLQDPQSLNRYAYVGNDPLNFVDPLGLHKIFIGNCLVEFDIAWVDIGNGPEIDSVQIRSVDCYGSGGGRGSEGFSIDGGGLAGGADGGGAVAPEVQAAGVAALAVSQFDGPLFGPADLFALGIIGTAVINNYQTHGSLFHVSFSEQGQIRAAARELGINPRELGRAVEAFKRSLGMRPSDNLTMDELRRLAAEVKAGFWKGTGR